MKNREKLERKRKKFFGDEILNFKYVKRYEYYLNFVAKLHVKIEKNVIFSKV